MKIEAGKFYKTRDGRKVGPMRECGKLYRWKGIMNGTSYTYLSNGTWLDGVENNKDLIAEWVDTPTLWRDMTPEEKGAILLAYHEGREIECWSESDPEWEEINCPSFISVCAYRIKPEPKRETLYWNRNSFGSLSKMPQDTHKITFDLKGGKPDCDSVKMERIK